MPPASASKSECEHIYLRQTILSPTLPPLYVANPAPPPHLHIRHSLPPARGPISSFLVTRLERVYSRLGPKRFRSPFLARDIALLQHELENGMSRARRQQVEIYVAEIHDPWKKACAELYLARYPGFVMRGDGRLDFGTRGREREVKAGILKGKRDWSMLGGCGIM